MIAAQDMVYPAVPQSRSPAIPAIPSVLQLAEPFRHGPPVSGIA